MFPQFGGPFKIVKFNLSLKKSSNFPKAPVLELINTHKGWCPSLSYLLKLKPSSYALRPIMMNNTCPFRFTATAGTKLVGASSLARS